MHVTVAFGKPRRVRSPATTGRLAPMIGPLGRLRRSMAREKAAQARGGRELVGQASPRMLTIARSRDQNVGGPGALVLRDSAPGLIRITVQLSISLFMCRMA